jgi:hypothetical protein
MRELTGQTTRRSSIGRGDVAEAPVRARTGAWATDRIMQEGPLGHIAGVIDSRRGRRVGEMA